MVGHTEGAEAANSANHPADTGGTGLPGWAKVVLVLGGIAAVVVVMFGLALWALIASVQPPSIDEERIQEQLEAEGPGLEAEARPVLEAARVGDRRCPGPTAGTASTAPQATRIGRLYCSRDVVAGAFGAGNVSRVSTPARAGGAARTTCSSSSRSIEPPGVVRPASCTARTACRTAGSTATPSSARSSDPSSARGTRSAHWAHHRV